MRVLITGGGGFLGRRLAQALVERATLGGAGENRAITELCLVDRAPMVAPESPRIALETLAGDLADPAFTSRLAARAFDSVFHLGASLTLEAEREPGEAYSVNVEPLRRFMEASANVPRIVYPSSIAVFGGELPDTVDDRIVHAPTTTYGMHKAICELLLADYSRKGRVDGRALRLPIVLVRPGAPSPAISDIVAGIVREPLAGREFEIPVSRDTRVPVASAGAVVRSLIALHDLEVEALSPRRAMNMPALTVRVDEMLEALTPYATNGPLGAIRFVPDAAVQAIVDGWPRRFVSEDASRLGIGADSGFDAVIEDYLAHSKAARNA